MATQADLARARMQKGDSDRLNAERTVQSAGPYDTACFHCQQAVEKYLKAIRLLQVNRFPEHTIWKKSTTNVLRSRRTCLSIEQTYPTLPLMPFNCVMTLIFGPTR
jgi:hypothetical protein